MSVTTLDATKTLFGHYGMRAEEDAMLSHDIIHTIVSIPPGSSRGEIIVGIYERVLKAPIKTIDDSEQLARLRVTCRDIAGFNGVEGEEFNFHFERAIKLFRHILSVLGDGVESFAVLPRGRILDAPLSKVAIENVISNPYIREEILAARKEWMGNKMYREFEAELEVGDVRATTKGGNPESRGR